jgi:hypothetical protein
MSNDSQLTINFQRVEQKQLEATERINTILNQMESRFTQKMAEMERRMEALGHADICFTCPPSGNKAHIWSYPIDSKRLEINAVQNAIHSSSFAKIKYFYQLEELILCNSQWEEAHKHMSNATVTKLELHSCALFSDISFIKNFPSLEDLTMQHFAVDASIVTTLRSIEHKIKMLTFQSVGGINQTEMQTYCTQNGIILNLS